MINVELFKEEWAKISQKLEQISKIEKLYGTGDLFEGYNISEFGITYKTSYYWSGCGTDYFAFDVNWSEINEPIEYFEEKYRKEIEADKIKKEAEREEQRLKAEEKEKEKLKELLNKYGTV